MSVKLAIDGAAAAFTDQTSGSTNSTYPLWIGRGKDGGYFKGLLDDITIFNPDQGSQFTSDQWTGMLEELGIAINMDGKARRAQPAAQTVLTLDGPVERQREPRRPARADPRGTGRAAMARRGRGTASARIVAQVKLEALLRVRRLRGGIQP